MPWFFKFESTREKDYIKNREFEMIMVNKTGEIS